MLTTRQASKILGTTRQGVSRLIHAGQIRAKRIGRDWKFKPEWVNDFIENDEATTPPMPTADRKRLTAARLN